MNFDINKLLQILALIKDLFPPAPPSTPQPLPEVPAPPPPPGIPQSGPLYPEALHLRATGGNYPDRTGGGQIEPSRFQQWLAGRVNINFDSKVWFDCTPSPDTVAAYPEMLGKVRWCVETQGGAVHSWKGIGNKYDRGDGVIITDGVGYAGFGWDAGVFKRDYARSDGYFVPVKFTEEGEFFVWCEVERPDGKVLTSNVIGPLKVS